MVPELPPIVRAGHPVLRAEARPLTSSEVKSDLFHALVEMMVAVMRAAPGVGLAAPQIGLPLALIVMEDDQERMKRLAPEELARRERTPLPLTILVNPEILWASEEAVTFPEGCLSVPGYAAQVTRARELEVRGLDSRFEEVRLRMTGWPARIVQHEVDHLRGTLYVDRMISTSFSSTEVGSMGEAAGLVDDLKHAFMV